MARNLRILTLLVLLMLVAGMTFLERLWVRNWTRPLQVAVYPIAADAAGREYLARLKAEDFQEIGDFLAREGQRWRRKPTPAPQIVVQPALGAPPPVPAPQGRSGLAAVRYSLGLRWYAFRNTGFWESLGRVRLFVLYHAPREGEALPHSLGLERGLIGVVHVYASDAQRAQNNIVIAHELLHTLGARDKYDRDGQPVHPIGYADFTADPVLPQSQAEIMAGRIPLTPGSSRIPRDLDEVVVGYATAAEIGW